MASDVKRGKRKRSNGHAPSSEPENRPPWVLPPELIAQGIRVPANIVEMIESPDFWGQWFEGDSWGPWKAFLRAAFALPMTDAERAIYKQCTGRDDVPAKQVREVYCIAGRRSGKSRLMATVCAFLASMIDFRPYLAAGASERATIMLIAADKRQARVSLRYLRSLLVQHGLLKGLVTRDTGEIIELSCGTAIEITTASFRSVRGYTVCGIVLDELAFFKGTDEDSSNPASEIINALKPAMLTIPRALLMAISSPHARRGPLWDAYRKHFGQPSDQILVWQAPTTIMNPTVDHTVIDEALEEDPSRASAEYLAQFRTDVEAFITREVIDACTVQGRHELPPIRGTRYVAFCDPSGGSGDSYTLCIAHRDQARGIVIDLVREIRPPFSPEDATWALAQVVKTTFGISQVHGDRYAGEWPREQWRKSGIQYEPSELNKSGLYQEALPVFNGHRVELLDHPRLHAQLLGLERRTARGGRDSVDHSPHGKDDLANCVAGAICLLAESQGIHVSAELLAKVRSATPWRVMQERRGF